MYRILYVDDDEVLLDINKIFLEKEGDFSVDIVQSGEDALEQIADRNYDAILSDYQMPGMDGIELLKVVRSRFGTIPFLLFTGKGREEIVIEAVNNGVDYYIQKGTDLQGMIAELKYKLLRAIERRSIGDALKKSRQQLADIINFLPDPTCVIDICGRVIAWNHAIEQMTGVQKSEMIGRGDYEYAVPFYGQRRPILMDFLLQNIPDPEKKYPVFEKNGSTLCTEMHIPTLYGGKGAYIWATAGPIYDAEGNLTGAIESVRDMTEIHRIKHDLGVSREMNRGFSNMIPVAIYEMDLRAILTFANNPAFDLFGIAKEDFGRRICILDYIVPADRDRAMRDIGKMIAGGTGVGQEYLLRRKDGSTFPGLIYGGTVIDPDTGKVTGLRGIIIDQTQRRQSAQALLESEERLKLAIKAGGIGIWDVDMRLMVVHDISDWIENVLGYDQSEPVLPMNRCISLVHPIDLPGIYSKFYKHLKGKAPLFESDFRVRYKDCQWRSVRVRGKVIECDSEGKPVRITGIVQEIHPETEKPKVPDGGNSPVHFYD